MKKPMRIKVAAMLSMNARMLLGIKRGAFSIGVRGQTVSAEEASSDHVPPDEITPKTRST